VVLFAVYIGIVLMNEKTFLPGMSVTELINTVQDVHCVSRKHPRCFFHYKLQKQMFVRLLKGH